MTHVTGIELGPSTCVLVSAGGRESGMDVAGAQIIHRSKNIAAFSAALKAARKAGRLPRRARIVSWSLAARTRADDPIRRRMLQPFVDAGFLVEALLTPAEALAQLAASRRRPTEEATAWASLNTHGAGIAIVDRGELLYSRTVPWKAWKYNPSPATVREQLLQRYVLVMHIAPELQRGIALVRANHGREVGTVVTCGDLPDLRSLTMPLIEELDLEVETLDSSDGLRTSGSMTADRVAEVAPAIRLACAAATVPAAQRPSPAIPASIAAALAFGLVAWLAVAALRRQEPVPAPAPPVVSEEPPSPAPRPEVQMPQPTASSGSTQELNPVGGLGLRESPPKTQGVRLPEIPALSSVLTSGGRQFALIGGSIVSVGDYVGPRVVVRIDTRSVVLREPSGAEITILLTSGHSDGVKSFPFAGHGRSPRTRTQAAR